MNESVQDKKRLINAVITKFYEQAIQDIFIGHHFRKIQSFEGSNPLTPPIEAFKDHLERIQHFWEVQLLGVSCELKFNLLQIHKDLSPRKGELSRWLFLFKNTIEDFIGQGEDEEFLRNWYDKALHFEKVFIQKDILIKN